MNSYPIEDLVWAIEADIGQFSLYVFWVNDFIIGQFLKNIYL